MPHNHSQGKPDRMATIRLLVFFDLCDSFLELARLQVGQPDTSCTDVRFKLQSLAALLLGGFILSLVIEVSAYVARQPRRERIQLAGPFELGQSFIFPSV